MTQDELQALHELGRIAGTRQLHQPERLKLAALVAKACDQIIGQSQRIKELKGASYQNRRDGSEDKNTTSVPDFLRGLFS